jgi:GH43 family beta-xylosidase
MLVDQTKWPSYSDKTMFHVATPAIHKIKDTWYMYFQAARAGDYISQNWALWGIRCDDVLKRLAPD